MVEIKEKLGLKNANLYTETYRHLRCNGYSQPKAMAQIMFAKHSFKVRELIIRDMLKAEKTLGSCKRK